MLNNNPAQCRPARWAGTMVVTGIQIECHEMDMRDLSFSVYLCKQFAIRLILLLYTVAAP